jgi:hypothetical protein
MPVINLSDADEHFRRFGDELQAAGRRGLVSAAARGVQEIITRIIPSRSPEPVDRGVYKAGWRFYPDREGAVIENLESVAALIEDGVRAENVKIGRAMILALAEWAVRKGLAEKDEAESVAWAIAKKMKMRGIFGREGMGILRELVDTRLDKLIQEEVVREIEKLPR